MFKIFNFFTKYKSNLNLVKNIYKTPKQVLSIVGIDVTIKLNLIILGLLTASIAISGTLLMFFPIKAILVWFVVSVLALIYKVYTYISKVRKLKHDAVEMASDAKQMISKVHDTIVVRTKVNTEIE